ncbi:hypothetical protein M419DRAFT_12377 [Trichoderma reesei RUT C-30]|uniref:Uncharacterized protein n=1 Tax=Hypocrea jecorina (strain ATCC 56765 / BCRC 32924 / NRRL 11460 / Rut C-30) TaxID=1344414 RepID=A0A024RY69_HYPJR|nr:hypothetical protein M419DRAFT_12377 [Trichoderma reesei RUT C-30]
MAPADNFRKNSSEGRICWAPFRPLSDDESASIVWSNEIYLGGEETGSSKSKSASLSGKTPPLEGSSASGFRVEAFWITAAQEGTQEIKRTWGP